jgi:mono/diheme cytochrome c family protein
MRVVLLFVGASAAEAGVPTKIPPDRERGEALYRVNCWPCHGAQALGDGPAGAPLKTPPLAGVIRPTDFDPQVEVVLRGRGAMPGYAEVLDRNDARRILVWLSELDPLTGVDPVAEKKKADEAKRKLEEEKRKAAKKPNPRKKVTPPPPGDPLAPAEQAKED